MTAMPTQSQSIGLIGLGLMGSVILRRLCDAGFSVMAHDIDATKTETAISQGATLATPEAMAATCGQIVLALFDTAQVEAMVEDPLSSANRPLVVICTSTCDPDRIADLAARMAPRGLRFLEAPVSGTSEQVRRGQGVALLGGDTALIDEAAPVLDALFATRHHVGACGDGGRAKLAVNLVLGLNRLALAEGLVLAERMGLSPATFLPVLRQSAAYSQVMDTKGPKMVSGDFAPQGKASQSLKDFSLILDLAARLGQSLPAASLNHDILSACVAAGEQELDNAVVIAELRRRG
jgi:3-hydroxyisobutyrate dehydrogenase-like beta-hydroxyacid dehydrogenase